MRVWVAVLSLACGCRQVFGLDDPTLGAATGDALLADSTGGDTSTTDASDCSLWQPHYFDPCAVPRGQMVFDAQSNTTIDSTAGTINGTAADSVLVTQTGGTLVRVFSVKSAKVAAGVGVRLTGTYPVIIAAWDSITVEGTIDAGSRTAAATTGPGSNPNACMSMAATLGADEADAGGGSGGGGGGAFQGKGGMGGPGDVGQNAGGAGGQAVASVPTIVRGGCSGAASGKAGPDANVADPNARASGGAGGGALVLAARNSITIQGTIVAGGGGGHGTAVNESNGGGGGGAGGLIALDAPQIDVASGAILAANGGGGGTGNVFANTGANGTDGGANATPAAGGAANSCSPAGGNGSAGTTFDGASASQVTASCGGGGGGGGAGFILLFGPDTQVATGSVVSPPPTQNPF